MSDTPESDPLPIPPFSPSRRPDTMSFLAIFLVSSFVGVIVLLIFHPLPESGSGMVNTLVGVLGTMATGVATFYFGSSKGSWEKDAARDSTMKTLVDKVVQNGAERK